MQQMLAQFGAMRRRFKWLSGLTLVFFAGMLIAGFQKPVLSLVLGGVNVIVYFAAVRPSLKRYNELYIRENALRGLGGRLREPTYRARTGVDAQRFANAGLFPSAMQAEAPLFTREVTGRCKCMGEAFNVRVAQVTFHYRRAGGRKNVFLCGAWIELEAGASGAGAFLLTTGGIPDTRFAARDFLNDGWEKGRCGQEKEETDAFFVKGGDEDTNVLPSAAQAAWNDLRGGGAAVIAAGRGGVMTVFLPGRFFAVAPPLQIEVSAADVALDRLPELEAALRLAAACRKAGIL